MTRQEVEEKVNNFLVEDLEIDEEKIAPEALEIVFKKHKVRSLYDVGGNTGKWALQCVGYDKDVEVTILDLPQQIGMMKYLQSCHTELPVGEVKLSDDELKTLLGLPVESLYSRTTLLGAVAVKQAMADAGLSADMLAGKKVVLISGTTVGGMDVTEVS